MRWRNALGREVVDISTAETIGHVDAMVVDASASSIVGMVIGNQVVSWSDTGGIGSDAVTVVNADLIREPKSDLELRAVEGASDPISKRVITEDGFALGSIADIEFDPESGTISRVILGDDHIAGSRLMGTGSFAVVVRSTDRSTADGDLASLTKSELYEMAKASDIDGRSTMSKDELIAALG
ncbi:MAG: PRC-barrel domain-containing protein [Acidimicrobiales bacterium]